MYNVESNIPIPPKIRPSGRRKGQTRIYPFNLMHPGDSFLVPAKTQEQAECFAHRIRSAASNYGGTWGESHVVRYVKNGVRCWRTS